MGALSTIEILVLSDRKWIKYIMSHQPDAMLWQLEMIIMNIIKDIKYAPKVMHSENNNVKYFVHQNYIYTNIYVNI